MSCGKCKTCKCNKDGDKLVTEVPQYESSEQLLVEVPQEDGKILLTETEKDA